MLRLLIDDEIICRNDNFYQKFVNGNVNVKMFFILFEYLNIQNDTLFRDCVVKMMLGCW